MNPYNEWLNMVVFHPSGMVKINIHTEDPFDRFALLKCAFSACLDKLFEHAHFQH